MTGVPMRPKNYTISQQEADAAKDKFIVALRRELIITGEDTEEVIRLTAKMLPHLEVIPRGSGDHEVRYVPRPGMIPMRLAEALQEIRETARLLSFGPNPEPLLVERLKKLGIPENEAKELAKFRVVRNDDGTVSAPGAYEPQNRPQHGVSYNDAETAAQRDPNLAITAATRRILREREESSRSSKLPSQATSVGVAF